MNKVVVNPSYADLNAFVQSLPESFEKIGQIIQNKRNDIRICEVNGLKLVIKAFKGMYFPNRLAYSLFWKSKSQRSYEYAFLLQSKGVKTPDAIGYVDRFHFGLLVESFYVSLYDAHPTFENLLQKGHSEAQELIPDLARFTRHLHLSGIYHTDYSNGNIICYKSGSQYTFGLLDLNRIKFRKTDFKQGLINFTTLNIPPSMLRELAAQYAKLANHNDINAEEFVIQYRNRKAKKRETRRWLKKKLGVG